MQSLNSIHCIFLSLSTAEARGLEAEVARLQEARLALEKKAEEMVLIEFEWNVDLLLNKCSEIHLLNGMLI